MILRSMLRQIIVSSSHLPAEIRKRYGERHAKGEITQVEAVDLIVQTINCRCVTLLFIDALDECDKEERPKLLEALQAILQHSHQMVKIFVSSRNDCDLLDFLSDYPNMSIEASNNQEDINLFVSKRVDDVIDRKPRSLLPTIDVSNSLRCQIKETLCDQAQGM